MPESSKVAQSFINQVLPYVTPGCRVLDLGAGQGLQAEAFLKAGAEVAAIDKKVPVSPNPSIDWWVMNLVDYPSLSKEGEVYDIIFAQNVIQFLDHQWTLKVLLPFLKRQVQTGGLLAMRTFFQEPEPAFVPPCRSYYTLNDLKPLFVGWSEIIAREIDYDSPDMQGQVRHFYITDILIQKP